MRAQSEDWAQGAIDALESGPTPVESLEMLVAMTLYLQPLTFEQ